MRRSVFNLALLIFLAPQALLAGGPKWIAGTSYFDPAVIGQPVRWATGIIDYYVDKGPLSSQINNQQATAMVDSAAALWSSVPTAGVQLTNSGTLAEDVSGTSAISGKSVFGSPTLALPSDVAPSATNRPLAVIYDADGSIIEDFSVPAHSIPPVARTMVFTRGSTTSAPTPPSFMPSSSSTASASPAPIWSR